MKSESRVSELSWRCRKGRPRLRKAARFLVQNRFDIARIYDGGSKENVPIFRRRNCTYARDKISRLKRMIESKIGKVQSNHDMSYFVKRGRNYPLMSNIHTAISSFVPQTICTLRWTIKQMSSICAYVFTTV